MEGTFYLLAFVGIAKPGFDEDTLDETAPMTKDDDKDDDEDDAPKEKPMDEEDNAHAAGEATEGEEIEANV